jgi:hypothetical protein
LIIPFPEKNIKMLKLKSPNYPVPPFLVNKNYCRTGQLSLDNTPGRYLKLPGGAKNIGH